jgi:hypothetical protein
MELHFYPGAQTLIVKDNNQVKKRFAAWGGPASMGSDPRMPEQPTTPGSYLIHSAKPYHTPTWTFSKIKWGTPLRDMPANSDVWYKLPGGKWGSVKKDIGVSRMQLIRIYKDMYGWSRVPNKWVFNDFGPIAIRWFEDLNGNGKMDGKEKLSGQMFHTTPVNEAEQALGKPVNLTSSHGCIHIKPADRDALFSLGAFDSGTRFVVHEYDEIP